MTDRIETRRTTIRPFTDVDAEAAFTWLGDAEVMRFTPTGPDRSIEETRKRLARYGDHQRRHGFSKWLVLDRISGEPIGDAGLQCLDECGPLPDLGFRLLPTHWRQGLATEIAAGWVQAAFTVHRLSGLRAFAHVDNHGSHRVLEKSGFLPQARTSVLGMESLTYLLLDRQARTRDGRSRVTLHDG